MPDDVILWSPVVISGVLIPFLFAFVISRVSSPPPVGYSHDCLNLGLTGVLHTAATGPRLGAPSGPGHHGQRLSLAVEWWLCKDVCVLMPGIRECGLIWKGFFADVVKGLAVRGSFALSERALHPTAAHGEFSCRWKPEGNRRQTDKRSPEKRRGHVMMEPELAVIWPQHRNASSHWDSLPEALEGAQFTVLKAHLAETTAWDGSDAKGAEHLITGNDLDAEARPHLAWGIQKMGSGVGHLGFEICSIGQWSDQVTELTREYNCLSTNWII